MPRVRIAAEGQDPSFLNAEIAHLRGLDIKALRARWRMGFGRDAPPHLPRHVLFAMIAYRLQAEVLGDLDAETVRFLNTIELAPSKQVAVPLTQAFERRKRELSVVAVLVRPASSGHGARRRFRLGGAYLSEPLRDRQSDHRHQMERATVLWSARAAAS